MIIALLMIISVLLYCIYTLLRKLDEMLDYNLDDIASTACRIEQQIGRYKVNKGGHVTDPFTTAKRRGVQPTSNSKHVVKPKTPDQIRAEHYREIKEGSKYGWVYNN